MEEIFIFVTSLYPLSSHWGEQECIGIRILIATGNLVQVVCFVTISRLLIALECICRHFARQPKREQKKHRVGEEVIKKHLAKWARFFILCCPSKTYLVRSVARTSRFRRDSHANHRVIFRADWSSLNPLGYEHFLINREVLKWRDQLS